MSKAGLLVTFDEDLNDEGAAALVDAIRCFKCVLSVEPVPASLEIHIAMDRVRAELSKKLFDVIYGYGKNKS